MTTLSIIFKFRLEFVLKDKVLFKSKIVSLL